MRLSEIMKNKKVAIIGMGYIGLPTAALIASKGFKVIGVDINQDIVDTTNSGESHFAEPDLEGLLRYVVEQKLLQATTVMQPADVYIITVPTPIKENNEPDISFVKSATKAIIPHLKKDNLIIIESTCPVGTTTTISQEIFTARPDLDGHLNVAYCPERILPGNMLYELENNSRIIGGMNKRSSEKAMSFYSNFVKGNLIINNSRTAELCKLAENAFRDVNIAFANELSFICDDLDINVWELIKLTNMHPRVNILRPGPGVGGHCIAVDPWFIVHSCPGNTRLIKAARETNNLKPQYVVKKIAKEAKKLNHPTISCLGLSYKENTDDLRESPAITIIEELIKLEIGTITLCEPNIKSHKRYNTVDIETSIKESDIIVILVKHKEFRKEYFENLNNKVIIDICGLLAMYQRNYHSTFLIHRR